MPKYKADIYLRVSYAADRNEESNSIANQKKLIEDFVASHPDIEIVSEPAALPILQMPSGPRKL